MNKKQISLASLVGGLLGGSVGNGIFYLFFPKDGLLIQFIVTFLCMMFCMSLSFAYFFLRTKKK